MKLTKKQREELKAKFGGSCAYCAVKLGANWQADHLIPIRRNWERYRRNDGTLATRFTDMVNPDADVIENLMPACCRCNLNKGSLPLEAWRKVISNKMKLLNNDPRYKFAKDFGLVEEVDKSVVFWFEIY